MNDTMKSEVTHKQIKKYLKTTDRGYSIWSKYKYVKREDGWEFVETANWLSWVFCILFIPIWVFLMLTYLVYMICTALLQNVDSIKPLNRVGCILFDKKPYRIDYETKEQHLKQWGE